MSSIAQPAALVSLRERAAQAWERQKAEVEARNRQEIERARNELISGACRALTTAFMAGPSDPWGYDHTTIRTAEYRVVPNDERWLIERPLSIDVDITFLGEQFVWRSEGGDPHALFHIWKCPACGETYEPPTLSNIVNSLAELGAWMDHAANLHGLSCGATS